jgi:hypothetical protein
MKCLPVVLLCMPIMICSYCSAQDKAITDLFDQINVPANLLPKGCTFPTKPNEYEGDAKYYHLTNPIITTNPEEFTPLIAFMIPHFVKMPRLMSEVDDIIKTFAERTDELKLKVSAGYRALYYDEDRKAIGVWALLFKDQKDFQASYVAEIKTAAKPIILDSSIIIMTWSDGNKQSPCYTTIRDHLENLSSSR